MPRYGASDQTTTAASYTAANPVMSSFVMPEDGTLDSVEALVDNLFSNPNYSIELYEESGGSASDPTGSTLVFATGEQVTPDGYQWVEHAAGGETLTNGVRYWLVVRGDAATNIGRVASPNHGDLELGSPSGFFHHTSMTQLNAGSPDDPIPAGATVQSFTNTIGVAINYTAGGASTALPLMNAYHG